MYASQPNTGKRLALAVTAVALASLIVLTLWNPSGGSTTSSATPETKSEPKSEPRSESDEWYASGGSGSSGEVVSTPEAPERPSGPMLLTIPRFSHLEGVEIPTAAGDDAPAMKHHAAIHVKGTGFPWQAGSNVYIAGHRIGYVGTPSFRAFYNLDDLRNGDEVILTGPAGDTFLYRVYDTLTVPPDRTEVTLPVPGKDIVSLQTCTLPDYRERIIVRAERIAA